MGPEGVFYYCSFVCAVEKQPQSLLATSSCFLQNSRAAPLTAAGAAHPPWPCSGMLLVPAQPKYPPPDPGHGEEQQPLEPAHTSASLCMKMGEP